MTIQQEIAAARELCIKAHAGQFRRDGVTPYHTHPFAVADAVPDELKPAALLHDVLEDADVTFVDLVKRFQFGTATTVLVLTKPIHQGYDDYMRLLIQSPNCVKIKIADMEHNLSCEPSEHSKQKIARWLPVLKRKDEEYEQSRA